MRGDVRMLDDPLRAQSLSLIAGVILAVIIVAVCAVLAFLRPPGTLGNAPIVMVRDSRRALRADRRHRASCDQSRLRSAYRRHAREPRSRQHVGDRATTKTRSVGRHTRCAGHDSPPLGEAESGWAVCDDATSTTVIAGDVLGEGLGSGHSVLVTPRSEERGNDVSVARRMARRGRPAQPGRRPSAEARWR